MSLELINYRPGVKEAPAAQAGTPSGASARPYIDIAKKEWYTPLLYLLCMAALGLHFYPILVFFPIFWLKAWKNDRYALIFQLTIFFGGYGLTDPTTTMKPWPSDIALGLSCLLWVVYRKTPLLRKTFFFIILYIAALFVLASFSLESMRIQIYTMRNYFGILYIIVPVACFAGHDFDIREFFRRLMPYVFIILFFYISDGFILPGNIFLPATHIWGDNVSSTFYSLYHLPLGSMMRKYPPGFYFVILAALPAIRYYRLRPWQWVVFIVALMATRTFTVITGFIFFWIFFQGSTLRTIKYIILSMVLGVGVYILDSYLPMTRDELTVTSSLRIKSSVDQFFELFEAVDDEDIAEFGSGRMAQILPKVDLMIDEGRTLTGLGFLHPQKTKITRYIITNDYYSDITQSEEVATAVEVIPVQIFINIGWIGLFIHCLFFLILYLCIRKLPYSAYYLSIAFLMSWFGLGGFVGLIGAQGLFVLSVAYAAIIMNARSKQ